jgi:hypothetical protein
VLDVVRPGRFDVEMRREARSSERQLPITNDINGIFGIFGTYEYLETGALRYRWYRIIWMDGSCLTLLVKNIWQFFSW